MDPRLDQFERIFKLRFHLYLVLFEAGIKRYGGGNQKFRPGNIHGHFRKPDRVFIRHVIEPDIGNLGSVRHFQRGFKSGFFDFAVLGGVNVCQGSGYVRPIVCLVGAGPQRHKIFLGGG